MGILNLCTKFEKKILICYGGGGGGGGGGATDLNPIYPRLSSGDIIMYRGWFKLKGLGLNYMRRLMKGCCDNVKLGPFNWLFEGKNCDVGKKLDCYVCVLFLVSFNLYMFNLLCTY